MKELEKYYDPRTKISLTLVRPARIELIKKILEYMISCSEDIANFKKHVFLKDLLGYIKSDFPELTTQKIGYLLKEMGFTKKRSNAGNYIDLLKPHNQNKFVLLRKDFDI